MDDVLTTEERTRFRTNRLLVCRHVHAGSGWVVNAKENGIAIGDLVEQRKNPNYARINKSGKEPDQRRYLHTFTDPHNAIQAARLHRQNAEDELNSLESTLVYLTAVRSAIPDWKQWNPDQLRRFSLALRVVANEHARALDTGKAEAAEQVAAAQNFTDRLGRLNPGMTAARVQAALERFHKRRKAVQRQLPVNAERRQRLNLMMNQELERVERLSMLAGQGVWYQDQEFKELAAQIRVKPFVLSVNNSFQYRHKDEASAWLVHALRVHDRFYGEMVKPMAILQADTVKAIKADYDDSLVSYRFLLDALRGVLEMAGDGAGPDHRLLLARLISYTDQVEEALETREIAEAMRLAGEYRYFLRYRCRPGEKAPLVWYTPVIGVQTQNFTPVPKNYRRPDDPFEGLPR